MIDIASTDVEQMPQWTLTVEQQAAIEYEVLTRDKRGAHELPCSVWDNGCKCDEDVIHVSEIGLKWCAVHQGTHDDGQAHPHISFETYLRKSLAVAEVRENAGIMTPQQANIVLPAQGISGAYIE